MIKMWKASVWPASVEPPMLISSPTAAAHDSLNDLDLNKDGVVDAGEWAQQNLTCSEKKKTQHGASISGTTDAELSYAVTPQAIMATMQILHLQLHASKLDAQEVHDASKAQAQLVFDAAVEVAQQEFDDAVALIQKDLEEPNTDADV